MIILLYFGSSSFFAANVLLADSAMSSVTPLLKFSKSLCLDVGVAPFLNVLTGRRTEFRLMKDGSLWFQFSIVAEKKAEEQKLMLMLSDVGEGKPFGSTKTV